MSSIQFRDPELYPENLKATLEQLTINEIPLVVGSTAYLQHKYPSDVDIFEIVTTDFDKEDASIFYATQFKLIAQKIKSNSKLYYGDIKIGYDPRFDVKFSDRNQMNAFTYSLLKNKLIDNKTFTKLYSSSEEDYQKIIRSYKILRWSLDEIIQEKKDLPGNKYISLKEAIQQNSLIKIDVITWIVNRYVSVEVFYNLKYRDPSGNYVPYHQLSSYYESLYNDILIYSSEKKYNPLKVAKRLWSLSRIGNCENLLKSINPILSSDAAALNQVVADIETLDILLTRGLKSNSHKKDTSDEMNDDNKNQKDYKNDKKMQSKILVEILGFEKRIVNHMRYDANINFLIQEIYTMWTVAENVVKDQVLDKLNVISSILKMEIIRLADPFLQKVKEVPCQMD